MSIARQDGWNRTSPLAAVFYLGKIYQAIAQNAVQYLAPLVAFLVAYEGNLMSKIVFGATTFFLVTVIGALLRYWFFRYRITDDSVLIREGVLKKTQLDIKFDRVQAINTQQSIIFRAFGLVTVMLDTAGSGKQEGHIPAVKVALASALKDRIRQAAPSTSLGEAAGDGDDQDHPGGSTRQILLLGAADMMRMGLSSNRALIFLAFLAPVIQLFTQNIENRVSEGVEESIKDGTIVSTVQGAPVNIADGIAYSVGFGLLIVFGILLFLAVASIAGAYLRYHRFELVVDGNVLRSTGGLLTRHEHSVNLAKIQSVLVSQNVMMRLFRRFRMNARQASSGRAGSGKSFVIPLCTPVQLPSLTRNVFGEEYTDAELDPAAPGFLPIAAHYFRSRFLLTGVLPAMIYTVMMSFLMGTYALMFLVWIPLNAYCVWRLYKRYGISVSSEGMALRRGFLGYRVTAFLHRKVQRISLTQTLSQRRKGLATLRFYLASGSVKVPYVDFGKACQLRDYVLCRIESSQMAWH